MPRIVLAFVRCVLVSLLACTAFAQPTQSSAPQNVAGHWKGAIEAPGDAIEIDVDLAQDSTGAWTGDISVPSQGEKDRPLEKLTVSGADVAFVITGIPGVPTFRGKLSPDGQTISGDYSQSGVTITFRLARAQSGSAESKQRLAGFGEWLDAARAAWDVPGCAVAIVRGGETIWIKGSGLRDVDAKQPATPDTLFAIGSCTKAFTTFVLATLVDEGKLAWDTPVRNYVPEFRMHDPIASERMTPRDLVTHRSGLPRHDALWYNATIDRAAMVGRLPYLPESKDFRTDFQYNNLMFLTAGYLAERVGGKTWEELVRARVFAPLGMQRSNFSVRDSQKDSDFAQPYEMHDGKLRHMPFRDIGNVGPAGSIDSSANEMARWVALHLSDGTWKDARLLQAATLADLHAPRMPTGATPTRETPEVVPVGYALGWFVDVYRGHLMVSHGGNIDGFSALVALLPQDDLGLVVLTNLNATPLPTLVQRHAFDRLLGAETKDWSAAGLKQKQVAETAGKEAKEKLAGARKSGTSPSHPLAEYAGEYADDGYGVIAIEATAGGLRVVYNGLSAPLEHWHYDVFNALRNEQDPALEDTKLLFVTGMDGEIEALRVSMEPAVADTLFARRPDAQLRDPKYLARFEGGYELVGQTVTVALKGDALSLSVPGQPSYALEPGRRDGFRLKGLNGYSLRFQSDAAGKVTGVEFTQPNGVFLATRK